MWTCLAISKKKKNKMKGKKLKAECSQFEHPRDIFERYLGSDKYHLIGYYHDLKEGYCILHVIKKEKENESKR